MSRSFSTLARSQGWGARARRGMVAQLNSLRVIGTRQRKLDGKDRVMGRTVYASDLRLPGMLAGKILRSPHPHARILAIDVTAAQRLPGVRAVIQPGAVAR